MFSIKITINVAVPQRGTEAGEYHKLFGALSSLSWIGEMAKCSRSGSRELTYPDRKRISWILTSHGNNKEMNRGSTEIINSIANIFFIGHSLVAEIFS